MFRSHRVIKSPVNAHNHGCRNTYNITHTQVRDAKDLIINPNRLMTHQWLPNESKYCCVVGHIMSKEFRQYQQTMSVPQTNSCGESWCTQQVSIDQRYKKYIENNKWNHIKFFILTWSASRLHAHERLLTSALTIRLKPHLPLRFHLQDKNNNRENHEIIHLGIPRHNKIHTT